MTMAELLIKAQQNEGTTGPGAYLRGHVVAIRPDGHQWGAKEGLPRFYVLQVPDAVLDDHPDLVREELSGGDLVRRREWTVEVDSLPPGIITALAQTGRAELTRGVLTAAVKRDMRLSVRGQVRG